jgi:hypothetical protein
MKYLKTFEIFSPVPMWIATGMLNRQHSNVEEDSDDNKDKPCKNCQTGHYRKTQMTKTTGELECDNCSDTIERYE